MIRIDDTEHPIVTVTFDGDTTDEAFGKYLADMTSLVLDRRLQTLTILDARKATAVSAAQRRAQAVWLRDNARLLARYSLGTVFVIESSIIRGVLTAILWLQPMPGPHIVVPSLALGRVWAKERIAEALAPAA